MSNTPQHETYILVRVTEKDLGSRTPEMAVIRQAIHDLSLIYDIKVADVPVRADREPYNGSPNPYADVKDIFDMLMRGSAHRPGVAGLTEDEKERNRDRHRRAALIRLGDRFKKLQGKILEAKHAEEWYRSIRKAERRRTRERGY